MNVIDFEKLENLVTTSTGWQARCPACAENNEDKKNRNHLGIQRDGKFNCLKYSGDKQHLARVLQLAGTESDSVISSYVTAPTSEPALQQEKIYPDSILAGLLKDYSYWIGRGIPEEVVSQFEGGVALKGTMKNRYCFVLRNDNGQIHGFDGRYIYKIREASGDFKETPRWKKIPNQKRLWIFDRKNVQKAILKHKKVILVEGIGCVLALRKVGIDYAVPIFGTSPSSHLLGKLIAWNPEKIIVSLNNEKSRIGLVASEKIRSKLLQFFGEDKIVVRLPDQKDWLDCSEEELKRFSAELA
jgi:hypothetical protein